MSITLSTLMRISFTLFYRVNETQLFHALVLHLGCVCFGWKWFQEIIFPQTRMFGCHGKWLPVDQYFHLWPENDFAPSFSLQIISGKREKEREERAQIREREREKREPRSRHCADDHTVPTSGAIDKRDRRDRAGSRSWSTARSCEASITISDLPLSPLIAIFFWVVAYVFFWICVFLLLFQTP